MKNEYMNKYEIGIKPLFNYKITMVFLILCTQNYKGILEV